MANEREKSLFQTPAMMDQERMVEAILFASKEPVKIQDFLNRMPHGCEPILARIGSHPCGIRFKKSCIFTGSFEANNMASTILS